jgi:hypothetical protein
MDYQKEFKKYVALQKHEAFKKEATSREYKKLARTIAWGYNGNKRAKSSEVLLKTTGRLWRRKLRESSASKG